MLVTAIATQVAAGTGGAAVGSIAVVLLIATLIAKEVAGHSGNAALQALHRPLTIATVPLSVAVGFALLQQITAIL